MSTATTQNSNVRNKLNQAFLRHSDAMHYLSIGQPKLISIFEQDSDFPRKRGLSTRCGEWIKKDLDAWLKPKSKLRRKVATPIKREPSLAVQVISSAVTTIQDQYAAPGAADGVEMLHKIRCRTWILGFYRELWQSAYVATTLRECKEGA